MAGPVAPKDPTEKRAGFYVLLDKQVGGIPQDDGRGRHSIFISSDRLPSFARVTGGIQDEAVLKLLTDVAGFRQLVHSLGVSISGRPGMAVDFCLMCKGNPGSCHRFTFPADGAERVITLEALDWSGAETGLGEFRFEFPQVSDMATVSVKCYVNDGYSIPEQDPDPAVDTGSAAYREMIARSFLSAGSVLPPPGQGRGGGNRCFSGGLHHPGGRSCSPAGKLLCPADLGWPAPAVWAEHSLYQSRGRGHPLGNRAHAL